MFSIFGQGYGQMNGTSMAAPFVVRFRGPDFFPHALIWMRPA